MGGYEPVSLGAGEPLVKYHPCDVEALTRDCLASAGTVPGGQFDWGGRLPKSNGGAQRSAQAEWKPAVECKGISRLDCERDISSRWETRS